MGLIFRVFKWLWKSHTYAHKIKPQISKLPINKQVSARNRFFSKEEALMASEYYKEHSTFLASEKCKYKPHWDTTLIQQEWKAPKNLTENINEDVGKEYLLFSHSWWESKLLESLWKSVWRSFKEQIEIIHDQLFHRDICTFIFLLFFHSKEIKPV